MLVSILVAHSSRTLRNARQSSITGRTRGIIPSPIYRAEWI
jgi:hypothetical protein